MRLRFGLLVQEDRVRTSGEVVVPWPLLRPPPQGWRLGGVEAREIRGEVRPVSVAGRLGEASRALVSSRPARKRAANRIVRHAGEGTRTLTPPEETPDFKSGAYDQFRHPGGARIAPGLLDAVRLEVVRGGDLGRRLAVDDRDRLVVLQDQVVRVSRVELAVQVDAQRLGRRRAVAPDALWGEAHAPDAHEHPERVRLRLGGLDVNDPGVVVRVQLGDERAVV